MIFEEASVIRSRDLTLAVSAKGPAAILAALLVCFGSASSAEAQTLEDLTDAGLALEWQGALVAYHFTETLRTRAPFAFCCSVQRTLSIEIDAPIDHVFAVYSDFDNHVGQHSFLKRVVTHEEYESDGVHVRNFTALEDVPLAGVPVELHTHAQQRVHEDAYFYESDSFDLPDVVTHQLVVFEDLGDGRTRVTERLTFETNLLLIDFTVANGVSAHEATMQGLKAAIESGAL
jgi:hypothetical protein